MKIISTTVSAKGTIKIDKKLQKIKLPKEKLNMLAEWWDKDIRFESDIPRAFEQGYFLIQNEEIKVAKDSTVIKAFAKHFHKTYREVENFLAEQSKMMEENIIYFKFVGETLYLETCDSVGNKISITTATFEPNEVGNSLNDEFTYEEWYEEAYNNFAIRNISYLITCLWFITTSASNTKYIYDDLKPVVTKRHKGIVKTSDTRYIRTPIYDIGKVREIKVERLITRKKGWTYTHSFQVRGHYRHYKSGKVIFVHPFIKGTGNFDSKTIVIDPSGRV